MGILDFETPEEAPERERKEETEKGRIAKGFIGAIVIFIILSSFGFGLYVKFINPELGKRVGLDKTVMQIATMKRFSSCVILDEPHCRGLVFQNNISDNSRLPGAVVKVSVGAAVYAPFDGIVQSSSFFTDGNVGRRAIVVYKADSVPSDPGAIPGMWFIASGWSENKLNGDAVKKGDLIGRVSGEDGLFKEMLGENGNNLIVFPSESWHDESGKNINNPTDYLKAFIEYAEKKPL